MKIDSVDLANRCVHISGLDLVDGTPVLDIKPCAHVTARCYNLMTSQTFRSTTHIPRRGIQSGSARRPSNPALWDLFTHSRINRLSLILLKHCMIMQHLLICGCFQYDLAY